MKMICTAVVNVKSDNICLTKGGIYTYDTKTNCIERDDFGRPVNVSRNFVNSSMIELKLQEIDHNVFKHPAMPVIKEGMAVTIKGYENHYCAVVKSKEHGLLFSFDVSLFKLEDYVHVITGVYEIGKIDDSYFKYNLLWKKEY